MFSPDADYDEQDEMEYEDMGYWPSRSSARYHHPHGSHGGPRGRWDYGGWSPGDDGDKGKGWRNCRKGHKS